MAEEDVTEEKMLNLEDILKGVRLKIDNAFAEVIRRDEMKDVYYEALFKLEKLSTRRVLRILRESGGSHRFTDIRRLVVCSPTTLNIALDELIREGLVRRVDGRYQAVSPDWFVQNARAR